MNNRIVINIFLIFILLLYGCSTLPPRLHKSGLNTEFNYTHDISFTEYIQKTRLMIGKNRTDLDNADKEKIIWANSPFELIPNVNLYPKTENKKFKKGILLIHGLTDSPYLLRPVARHLQSKGFLVRTILLPGHGTIPGDLLSVKYETWIKAVEYGMYRLRLNCEETYIGGFSTGGTLSMNYSLKNPDKIKGLILFSPAIGIKSKAACLSVYLNYFKDWLSVYDDNDYTKYESFAINGAAQIYKLTERNKEILDKQDLKPNFPVFAVLSEEDKTIDSEKTIDIFNSYLKSDKNRIILYTTDPGKYKNNEDLIIAQNSYIPDQHILNFGHISITVPPNDPHYGRNGDYRNCLHYFKEKDTFSSCLENPDIWWGETNKKGLEYALKNNLLIGRLAFNPHFDRMIKYMDDFLSAIE
ncbi:MAG: alpha/beta fold hydrolase [Thermodesulfobacteriota bacterium]|nr:alpha/beta fold hydrolase [Thermodesulfobacteriota bacterium]